jgi:hypothetical protein
MIVNELHGLGRIKSFLHVSLRNKVERNYAHGCCERSACAVLYKLQLDNTLRTDEEARLLV